MIDISALKHFVAVAEHASFTKASEQLRTDVSAVSRSIKRLEQALSAKLVERTTRLVRLTPAGEIYYDEARLILARLEAAGEKVRRASEREPAALRVAVCQAVQAEAVGRGLQAFRRLWPGIEIRLSLVQSRDQPKALHRGEVDAGVLKPDLLEEQGLDCKMVGQDALEVVAPASWKLAAARVKLQDLDDRPWILPDPHVAPQTHRRLIEICASAGFEPTAVAFVADAASMSLLLACGVGAAFRLRSAPPVRGCDVLNVDGLTDPFGSATAVAWAAKPGGRYQQDFELCLRHALTSSAASAPPMALAN